LYGWLVTNSFLRTEKFNLVPEWLSASAHAKDLELECKINTDVLCKTGEANASVWKRRPDFILFWDKDLYLAKYLEGCGIRLFNTAESMRICDDKMLTHLELMESGIAMPATIAAPLTFDTVGYPDKDFLEQIVADLGFPMVVKECKGSFGREVYLVNTSDELVLRVTQLAGKPLLFQELLTTSFGRDIRIQVVGDRVVTTMYRHSESGDFRANVTNGGSMERYEPNGAQESMALAVTRKLGLDFAGVDILFGEDDEPVFCEVNSNAHFKNIYDSTGINSSDAIIEYIIKEMYGQKVAPLLSD
jgi:RimK family alpha-L-glutamate ligase